MSHSVLASAQAQFKMPTAEEQAVLFAEFSAQLAPFQAAAKSLQGLDSPTQEQVATARELRLKVVKVRTGAADAHKAAKEGALAYGRALDNAKNTITADCKSVEEMLEAVEKAAERKEAQRIAELVAYRRQMIGEYASPSDNLLSQLSDEDFETFFSGAKAKFEAQKAAEELAARERHEAEQRRLLEIEAQAKENERLKALAAAQQAALEASLKEAAQKQKEADAAQREAAERERVIAQMKAEKEAKEQAAQREAAEAAAKKQKHAKALEAISASEERFMAAAKIAFACKDEAKRNAVLLAIIDAAI